MITLPLWMRKLSRCKHRFAIEDIRLVNPNGAKDRVQWACDTCGEIFTAHCGIDISPKHGPTFRRNPTRSTRQ